MIKDIYSNSSNFIFYMCERNAVLGMEVIEQIYNLCSLKVMDSCLAVVHN